MAGQSSPSPDYSNREGQRRISPLITLIMKRSAIYAMTVCFLFTLNGCYQGQRQSPSPAGAEQTGQQNPSVTGPFGEQVAEPTKKSPFEQPQKVQAGAGSLESEVAGTLKPPALKGIDSRISAYNRKMTKWNELDGKSATGGLSPEIAAKMGGCYQELQKMLSSYNTLRSAVVLGDGSDVAENSVYNSKMQALQQGDIEFLEGECGGLLERHPGCSGKRRPVGCHDWRTAAGCGNRHARGQ